MQVVSLASLTVSAKPTNEITDHSVCGGNVWANTLYYCTQDRYSPIFAERVIAMVTTNCLFCNVQPHSLLTYLAN